MRGRGIKVSAVASAGSRAFGTLEGISNRILCSPGVEGERGPSLKPGAPRAPRAPRATLPPQLQPCGSSRHLMWAPVSPAQLTCAQAHLLQWRRAMTAQFEPCVLSMLCRRHETTTLFQTSLGSVETLATSPSILFNTHLTNTLLSIPRSMPGGPEGSKHFRARPMAC